MKTISFASFLSVIALLAWAGCGTTSHSLADKHEQAAPFAGIAQAVCVLAPTEGNKTAGTVRFVEKDGKVTVTAEVTGLGANQKHAIHIHEFGDISDAKGMATGGHYNPEGHEHGLPDKDKRHAGDFGNLEANAEGKATLTFTVNNLSVAGAKNPVLGRAIIVHAKPDDGSQPVGNAGPRIAQGVIGVAKVPQPAK